MKFKHGSFMDFFVKIGWKFLLLGIICLSIVVGSYAFLIWVTKLVWNL